MCEDSYFKNLLRNHLLWFTYVKNPFFRMQNVIFTHAAMGKENEDNLKQQYCRIRYLKQVIWGGRSSVTVKLAVKLRSDVSVCLF